MVSTAAVPARRPLAHDCGAPPNAQDEIGASIDRRIKTTIDCYSVFDKFFPSCGLLDYTEGMYQGDPSVPFAVAQLQQIRYLLDEGGCRADSRVLDIGCGHGTLLDEVRARGATGVGITISPEQLQYCRRRRHDVCLLNYRDLGDRWNQRFDAVVANGSIEHFVQPLEAARGQDDELYRELFEIVHRVIDPDSPNRRFISTTIHFVRPPKPSSLLRDPDTFAQGSDDFHFSLLAHSFGGWYPTEGQLERCAKGYFKLINLSDGTHDYWLTSEAWLRRIRQALRSTEALRILWRALPAVWSQPRQLATMIRCLLICESWNWQFRGAHPPTRLLRQTWAYVD